MAVGEREIEPVTSRHCGASEGMEAGTMVTVVVTPLLVVHGTVVSVVMCAELAEL